MKFGKLKRFLPEQEKVDLQSLWAVTPSSNAEQQARTDQSQYLTIE